MDCVVIIIKDKKFKASSKNGRIVKPEHVGIILLEFLRDKFNQKKFIENLDKIETINFDKLKELWKSIHPNNEAITEEVKNIFIKKHPGIYYDSFDNIIEIIQEKAPQYLLPKIITSEDVTLVDWGYILDLDKQTFEIYEGYNKKELEEGNRFSYIKGSVDLPSGSYYPMKEIKVFDLNNLPDNQSFLQNKEFYLDYSIENNPINHNGILSTKNN